jgi:hypothetical protein
MENFALSDRFQDLPDVKWLLAGGLAHKCTNSNVGPYLAPALYGKLWQIFLQIFVR